MVQEVSGAVAEETPQGFGQPAPAETEPTPPQTDNIEQPPAEAEAEPQEPTEGAEPSEETDVSPPPETWESLEERILGDESLKDGFELKLEDERNTAREAARKEIQSRLQPMWQEYRDNARITASAFPAMVQQLQQMVESDNVDEQTLNRLFQQNAPAFHAVNSLGFKSGTFAGAKNFIRIAEGGIPSPDPSAPEGVRWKFENSDGGQTAQSFSDRIDGISQGTDTEQTVIFDYIEHREKVAEERGFQRGLKKGRSTNVEAAKGETRQGQQPTHAGDRAGGGPVISSMADADREYVAGRLSHGEYKEYRRKFDQPDRATYGR